MAYERHDVLEFVRRHFSQRWASEVAVGFSGHPLGCFIAIRSEKIIGFSCFDCTFRGFYGPLGIAEEARGRGIGTVLMLATLQSMHELGHAYAIVGGVDEARAFYERTFAAQSIADSDPGPYFYDLSTSPPKSK
jgi:GNAT superfamily N-acetyltransferase